MFKADRCESTLLDIRQTKLQCDEARFRVVKEVETAFSEIIKTLKDRKKALLYEIESHFAEQIEAIKGQEEKWYESCSSDSLNVYSNRISKQDVSLSLLKYGQANDMPLVRNSQEIYSGLENLHEPMTYHLAQILNSMDLHFRVEGKGKQVDLNLEELLRAFSSYGRKGEINNIQYRC